MTEPVTFVVPGKPYAQKRPRAYARGGKAGTYNPAENRSFAETIGVIARVHFPEPRTGPVRVEIEAVFEPARSWSKRRRESAMGTYHTQKPDRDNVEKAVLDGLSRIAWADDAQVADGRCVKRWGPVAQTTVTVEPLPAEIGAPDNWRSIGDIASGMVDRHGKAAEQPD